MSSSRGVKPVPQFQSSALAALHAELGIPSDYVLARGLPLQPEASAVDLVTIPSADAAREIRLVAPAAVAWRRMYDAARSADIVLLPLSGFRNVERQAEIIRAHRASGRSMEDLLRTVAAPGYSEHHTGRAVDIGTPGEPPLEESFSQTPAFAWLSQHASGHGFGLSYPRNNAHGIGYEPWHWCWHL